MYTISFTVLTNENIHIKPYATLFICSLKTQESKVQANAVEGAQCSGVTFYNSAEIIPTFKIYLNAQHLYPLTRHKKAKLKQMRQGAQCSGVTATSVRGRPPSHAPLQSTLCIARYDIYNVFFYN